MFFRAGHNLKHFVVLGQKVKKGDLLASVGTGNGQYSSHLHADFPKEKLSSWTEYVFGISKEGVKHLYADPQPYRKIAFPSYDHMGWGYLEYATYGTKHCYHPGEDWNGKGGGNADLGQPIYAPFDGEVVYIYDGTGTNGGWGKLLVLKEVKTEVAPTPQISTETPVATFSASTVPYYDIEVGSETLSGTEPLPINAVSGDTGIMEKKEVVQENHPDPEITPLIFNLLIKLWRYLKSFF